MQKVRFVAHGFAEYDIDKEYLPASKYTLKAIHSILISNGWNLKAINIKTTFLQGEFLKRQIYLKLPVEANCQPSETMTMRFLMLLNEI